MKVSVLEEQDWFCLEWPTYSPTGKDPLEVEN